MENYNNILYTSVPFEESIKIDNKQYYRYMDKLYIPEIPSALKLQDVISLSEIRIKKGNELICTDVSELDITKIQFYAYSHSYVMLLIQIY